MTTSFTHQQRMSLCFRGGNVDPAYMQMLHTTVARVPMEQQPGTASKATLIRKVQSGQRK